MRKVVVTKTTAQALRDMGYDEYCDCYLHTDNDREDDYEMWPRNQHCNSELPDTAERIAAPYVTDALLWLMERKGIKFDVQSVPFPGSGWEYYLTVKHPEGHISLNGADFQEVLSAALDEVVSKI